ncbi:hypothetical protein [Sphingomonas sp. 10B4]|uniref:hypothetical protein n=1 Tax=Sphingomonas sp. 10B4 TaxID=3048575 RepID=UPI002AB53322|nr:hypothetical protein [Sphingomonas sp. 10B4]MDY7526252.1 hypothetical protein [Sphingomonas sp. 10B4]MEB0283474.1 hypothetical protein [Sphingomonas sp. 10B4]
MIVMRHGLRSPIESPAELATLAGRAFPLWPVAAGDLTPRGMALLRGMAQSVGRDVFDTSRVGQPCMRRGTVWADARDGRTILSGKIVADGLGRCSDASQHGDKTVSDPLFDATRAGKCPLPANSPSPSMQEDRRSRIAAARYLAYAQGLSFQTDGATERQTVFNEMPHHERQVEQQFERLPAAGARTSSLTQAIVAFLDGHADPRSPLPAEAQVATIVGHDTDLAGLKAVFGLHWALPGQPDSTGPATALVLRASPADSEGRRRISATVYYQTLADMRAGVADKVKRVPLKFDGCASEKRCSWTDVSRRALGAVPSSCSWDSNAMIAADQAKR